MPTDPSIPFPADLDALCVPGCLDALSAAEVGALYRLVRHAWQQEDPCTLVLQDDALAMVARVTKEEWAAMRPRILLTLVGTHPTPPGGLHPAGEPTEHAPPHQRVTRVTLGHARSVYLKLASASSRPPAARAAPPPPPPELSEARRAAGLAGARSRWQSDGKTHGKNGNLPSFAMIEKSARSSSESLALSLSAPSSSMNQSALSLSAQGAESAGEIAGILGGRAGAENAERQLAEKLARWKRDQSFSLLRTAWEAWSAAGLTTCPYAKIAEIASSEHATPARMELLIQDATAKVARAKASGEFTNPIGVVIFGLGLVTDPRRRRVADVPIFVSQRWDEKEAAAVRIFRAQIAIGAATDARVREHVGGVAGRGRA
jgi:hypothetical protein